ncbi:MAG: hypothetical protein RR614_13710 [Eubacterium sp.]
MNRKLGMWGSLVNVCAVAVFALCMLLGSADMGSYFASIFIAFGFVIMICSFCVELTQEKKAAGYTAMIFAGMYAVLILMVYFAQLTTVRLDSLTGQALKLLDFQQFGLFFSYDLLGYSLMALSTFFIGITITVRTKADQWLKWLLIIHGVFFIACLLLPMLGVFRPDMEGVDWIGVAVLEFWCAYFIPVGILSFLHFKRQKEAA